MWGRTLVQVPCWWSGDADRYLLISSLLLYLFYQLILIVA